MLVIASACGATSSTGVEILGRHDNAMRVGEFHALLTTEISHAINCGPLGVTQAGMRRCPPGGSWRCTVVVSTANDVEPARAMPQMSMVSQPSLVTSSSVHAVWFKATP